MRPNEERYRPDTDVLIVEDSPTQRLKIKVFAAGDEFDDDMCVIGTDIARLIPSHLAAA